MFDFLVRIVLGLMQQAESASPVFAATYENALAFWQFAYPTVYAAALAIFNAMP